VNVSQAAAIWIEEKQEIERRKGRLESAAEVLKAHFRKTGKSKLKISAGVIGFAEASRLQLDTAAVKAELGDRLPDFQTRITYEQLSLLK
jgi:hypothetical protein